MDTESGEHILYKISQENFLSFGLDIGIPEPPHKNRTKYNRIINEIFKVSFVIIMLTYYCDKDNCSKKKFLNDILTPD